MAPMIDQSELVRGLNSLMFLDHTGDPRHGGHCPDVLVHKSIIQLPEADL